MKALIEVLYEYVRTDDGRVVRNQRAHLSVKLTATIWRHLELGLAPPFPLGHDDGPTPGSADTA